MLCSCAAPPDANGKPILAQPACILTNCADTRAFNRADSRPLCALTCDPAAIVPPGRSNCQPGATCERVPGAGFTPAGVCTFTKTDTMPHYVSGDNATGQRLPQLPGWSWADYKCAPNTTNSAVVVASAVVGEPRTEPSLPIHLDETCMNSCTKPRERSRFTCIRNSSKGDWHNTFCVDISTISGSFPYP